MAREKRIDSAERVIGASAKAVYAAFADPTAWEQWLPPTGMTGRIEEFEFREGGRYRVILHYGDGSGAGKTNADEDVSEGTFVELVPNQRIVQRIQFESDDPAFAGAMQMTWEIAPFNDGVRVTFSATDVPEGISPEDHAVGLQSTLENLARFVE